MIFYFLPIKLIVMNACKEWANNCGCFKANVIWHGNVECYPCRESKVWPLVYHRPRQILLIAWLPDCLIAWLPDCLIAWLPDCLITWTWSEAWPGEYIYRAQCCFFVNLVCGVIRLLVNLISPMFNTVLIMVFCYFNVFQGGCKCMTLKCLKKDL